MNPIEVENAVRSYLDGLQSIPSTVQVHSSVSADDLDFEKPAIVVELESAEHRGASAWVGTIKVSVRSPAQAVTLSDHSSIVAAVVAALRDKTAIVTAFNAAASSVDLLGIAPLNYGAPTFQDRAWINTIMADAGFYVTQ